MRSLMLVVSFLAGAAVAEPAVLLFPALGSPEQVTLSGRVLKHGPSRGSSTLSRNLRRLTSSNWEGAPVEVRYADQKAEVVSGHDGNFSVTFQGTPKPLPAGLSTAEAKVPGAPPGVATVEIVAPAAPFFVISDFDDTLAVTNVVDKRGLVKAALLQDEATQPVVEGMAAFYDCLAEGKGARPSFALVSGSPAQYLGRVREFLSVHHFPVFGIYLRDIGPDTLKDYKQPVIRALLASVPNPVVLVGDSGEHDPEVYRQMQAEFPQRVKAVYIRDAGKSGEASRFEGMTLFRKPEAAALDAVKKGLASAECVARAFPGKEAK